MGRSAARVLYAVAMAAVVVGVDVLFFRGHVWERLAANVVRRRMQSRHRGWPDGTDAQLVRERPGGLGRLRITCGISERGVLFPARRRDRAFRAGDVSG
jgi:hypothetical protein